MTLRACADRVFLRHLREKERGLIALVSATEKKTILARVVAAGPGLVSGTSELRPGDLVLIPQFTGDLVQVDGEELAVVREDEVLAVVDDLPLDGFTESSWSPHARDMGYGNMKIGFEQS